MIDSISAELDFMVPDLSVWDQALSIFTLMEEPLMYIVFKSIEDWFKERPEIKSEFQNTYQTIVEFVQQNIISLNKSIKEKTGQDIEVVIGEQLLRQVLIDAYDDLLRLTNFHPTDTPNPIKKWAYIVYWLVRHKPIRLMSDDIVMCDELSDLAKSRLLFINEHIGVKLLMSAAFKGKKEQQIFSEGALKEIHDEAEWQLKYYKRFLLYYLVYRLETPKELEAIVLGCTIYPIWEVDPVIWACIRNSEQKI